jgi:hypothetical protein
VFLCTVRPVSNVPNVLYLRRTEHSALYSDLNIWKVIELIIETIVKSWYNLYYPTCCLLITNVKLITTVPHPHGMHGETNFRSLVEIIP